MNLLAELESRGLNTRLFAAMPADTKKALEFVQQLQLKAPLQKTYREIIHAYFK